MEMLPLLRDINMYLLITWMTDFISFLYSDGIVLLQNHIGNVKRKND